MTPDTHADTDTGADTSAAQARPAAGTTAGAVSYTHLTLPTICSV